MSFCLIFCFLGNSDYKTSVLPKIISSPTMCALRPLLEYSYSNSPPSLVEGCFPLVQEWSETKSPQARICRGCLQQFLPSLRPTEHQEPFFMRSSPLPYCLMGKTQYYLSGAVLSSSHTGWVDDFLPSVDRTTSGAAWLAWHPFLGQTGAHILPPLMPRAFCSTPKSFPWNTKV